MQQVLGEHILIVDDEVHTRLALTIILRQAGYRAQTAANGQEALAVIEARAESGTPFDLLITDVRMPLLDGIGLVDALRQRQIRIPIIVITGYGDRTLIAELERRGCCCLAKPLSPQQVLQAVVTTLADGATLPEGWADSGA